jgi:hypothetical protein
MDVRLRVDPLGASDGLRVRERQRAGAGGRSRASQGVDMEYYSPYGSGYVLLDLWWPCAPKRCLRFRKGGAGRTPVEGDV